MLKSSVCSTARPALTLISVFDVDLNSDSFANIQSKPASCPPFAVGFLRALLAVLW